MITRTAPCAVNSAEAPRLDRPSKQDGGGDDEVTGDAHGDEPANPNEQIAGRGVRQRQQAEGRRIGRQQQARAGHQHARDQIGINEIHAHRPHQRGWLGEQRGGIRHAGECQQRQQTHERAGDDRQDAGGAGSLGCLLDAPPGAGEDSPQQILGDPAGGEYGEERRRVVQVFGAGHGIVDLAPYPFNDKGPIREIDGEIAGRLLGRVNRLGGISDDALAEGGGGEPRPICRPPCSLAAISARMVASSSLRFVSSSMLAASACRSCTEVVAPICWAAAPDGAYIAVTSINIAVVTRRPMRGSTRRMTIPAFAEKMDNGG